MEGGFKVPHTIPQDLLLIQQLIGVSPSVLIPKDAKPATPSGEIKKSAGAGADEDEDISSSSDESASDDEDGEAAAAASEEEIVAELVSGALTDEDDVGVEFESKTSLLPAESTSGSESDSESSEEEDAQKEHNTAGLPPQKQQQDLDGEADEDEDGALPSTTSGSYFQTKNEVPEADIIVPELDEVGPDEVLEKVGEVMNIVDDRVAIVRGLSSGVLNRGSDRALDSDTLLVFEDRKVMGYIYETFGPTSQPLYQVKYNSAYPLDPERVREGREVFHVPARSRFVFLSQIKAIKGSDASNLHDEEPADDELDFSDDEKEAAWKSRFKRKRGESRARSVASTRQATPNPSFMRDQELADEGFFSRNAYDEHGPYDIDYASPGPSSARPAPIPYDDPYADDYTAPDHESTLSAAPPPSAAGLLEPNSSQEQGTRGERGYERSDGVRGGRGRDRDRRGRDRGGRRDGHRERGRGRGRGGGGRGSQQGFGNADHPQDGNTRSLSPTSLAIARATGQGYPGLENPSQNQNRQYRPSLQQQDSTGYPPVPEWGYSQPSPFMQHYGYGMQHQHQQQHQRPAYHGYDMNMPGPAPFVQPHINPRFMSAFGMGMQGQYSGGGGGGGGGISTQSQMPMHQQRQQTYPFSQASSQNGSLQHPGLAAPSELATAPVPPHDRSSSSAPLDDAQNAPQ